MGTKEFLNIHWAQLSSSRSTPALVKSIRQCEWFAITLETIHRNPWLQEAVLVHDPPSFLHNTTSSNFLGLLPCLLPLFLVSWPLPKEIIIITSARPFSPPALLFSHQPKAVTFLYCSDLDPCSLYLYSILLLNEERDMAHQKVICRGY